MAGTKTTRVKDFRTLNGFSIRQLVAHLRDNLGVNVSATSIGRWERGLSPTPQRVLDYMAGKHVAPAGADSPADGPGGGAAPSAAAAPEGAQGPDDAPPGAFTSESPPVQPLKLTEQAYEKACIELWQMIGFGVQVAGKGLARPVVQRDGDIIQAMSGDLGRAYGKLAEQNETFRRIIVGVTQGGVWVEVTGVTVQLAMAIAQNHRSFGVAPRPEPAPEPEPEREAA